MPIDAWKSKKKIKKKAEHRCSAFYIDD